MCRKTNKCFVQESKDAEEHECFRSSTPMLFGSLMELARLRQLVYRFLGILLLYPDEERLMTLIAAAEDLQVESEPLTVFPFFRMWQRLLITLRGLAEDETTEVEEEYVRLFLVNPEAPPYESFYIEPQRRATGWIMAQLEREYDQAGLILSPEFGELSDHVAVELEFMAFLCDQEAQGWDKDILAEIFQALERQREFLGQHLGRWFPIFAGRVKQSAPKDLYDIVVEAIEAFIKHDFDLVYLLIEGVSEYE